MTKVCPDTIIPVQGSSSTCKNDAVVFTVWKKSLVFNWDGFTVYDSKGNLVYRVDNYVAGGNGEIILMNASGRSLYTICRKLRLSDSWIAYDGETLVKPMFIVKKHLNRLNTKKSLAYVILAGSSEYNNVSNNRNIIYEIERSYTQNCGVVYDDKRRWVAEIRRKEAKTGVSLGGDVFNLVVQPLINPNIAMALLIALYQMFGSSRHFLT